MNVTHVYKFIYVFNKYIKSLTHDAYNMHTYIYLQLCIVLQKADLKVAERVGVSRGHLQRLVQSGKRRNPSEADIEKERICKRFFMALMLNDVIQEVATAAFSPKFCNIPATCCFLFCLAFSASTNSISMLSSMG